MFILFKNRISGQLHLWQLVLCLLMFACTKSIELPFPNPQPLLVVNTLFSSDSTWKIHISSTSNLADTSFILPAVAHARIQLYENDSLIGSPQYAGNGNYRLDHYPVVGSTYRIKVEAAGFPSVEAVDSLPAHAINPGGTWFTDTAIPLVDEFGTAFTSFLMDVHFEDVPNEQNFYHVAIAMRDSCVCYFPSEDTTVVDPFNDRLWILETQIDEPFSDPNSKKANSVLLQDISFQNDEKHISFYMDTTTIFYAHFFPFPRKDSVDRDYYSTWVFSASTPRKYIRVYADVRSISETLYLYESSYFRQGFGTADPFYEFGNVYSNIKNGLGVFAGFQRQLVEIYSD